VSELEHVERLLAEAFTQRDPLTWLREREGDLPEAIASVLPGISDDGARIASILVARLRFERLVQGSRIAGEWYDTDARAFTLAFKRYHAEVPSEVLFPKDEARLYEAWLERQDDRP